MKPKPLYLVLFYRNDMIDSIFDILLIKKNTYL